MCAADVERGAGGGISRSLAKPGGDDPGSGRRPSKSGRMVHPARERMFAVRVPPFASRARVRVRSGESSTFRTADELDKRLVLFVLNQLQSSTERSRIRPSPRRTAAEHARRLPGGSPMASSSSASRGSGGSSSSAPSRISTRQVAQLAPRQENGTGAEASSQMSTRRPPVGSSTVMAGPAALASKTMVGMGRDG